MNRSIAHLTTPLVAAMSMLLAPIGGQAAHAAVPGWTYSQEEPPTIREAQQLQQAGQWQEAAHAWYQITEAEPDNGTAWFNLGYCLHAAGQLEKAIKVHKKASTFEQYHGIALYNLGCAYALTGERDKAIEALAAGQAAGFTLAGRAEDDSDLESLLDDPRFQELLRAGQARHAPAGRGGGMGGMPPELAEALQNMPPEAQQIVAQIQQILHQLQPMLEQLAASIERIAANIERALQENEQLGQIARMIQQRMSGGGGQAQARRQPPPPPPPPVAEERRADASQPAEPVSLADAQ
ncbi:MAG: tetratricopeptide repeat protein, partial [Planctomycetota bacterium]